MKIEDKRYEIRSTDAYLSFETKSEIDFITDLSFRMKHHLESSADDQESVERQRFKPDPVRRLNSISLIHTLQVKLLG